MTAIIAVLAGLFTAQAPTPAVARFAVREDHVRITVGDRPLATYVFRDAAVRRPYFAHVHAPSGVQVTRNHPPIPGKDAVDHATMHPGIWLAFGDVSGADFWRNQGTVKHAGFIATPGKRGSFVVRNRYEASGKLVAEEVCRIGVHVRPAGYLLTLDSTFTSPDGLIFGDQEEMGLGVRVASSMTVKSGGEIRNSDGLTNEKQAWGKQADWCAYSGKVEGKSAGVLLMPHPDNFRRSWFHVRDYGLMVANPFGRKAFTRGEASRIVVGKNASLRLRFGVLIHDAMIDGAACYKEYVRLAADGR